MQHQHPNDTAGRRDERSTEGGRSGPSLGESAQQVWLAGIGALARAQAEGSRFFEQLAEEGRGVADAGSDGKGVAARLEGMRQSVDAAMERTYARAGETWDSLGRVFERRIQQTLRLMDVPTRQDIDLLGARIDALAAELRRGNDKAQATIASPDQPPGI